MKLAASQIVRNLSVVVLFVSTFVANTPAEASLYSFTTHTFTNCSATGNTGPTQANCRSAYSTTWDESDANYTVTNGIQLWTVPVSGTYRVRAIGATGGGYSGGFYGYGASIQGEFSLTQGETLKVLVGQQGLAVSSYGQGGGGGSFVTRSNNSALVIAGGGGSMSNGGGEAGSERTARACGDASLTTSGKPGCAWAGFGDSFGAAGTSGNGGGAVSSSWNGYPGSGFLSDASIGGAKSWANGSLGGNLSAYGLGGFGGGGSGGMYGGSGGGGYSGGGASSRHAHGGGGGSFNSGANKVEGLTSTVTQGSVVITLVAVAISDTTTSLNAPSSLTYRTATNIVATVSAPGRVTFFENGKRIGGCISIRTVTSGAITATCSYKPATRGLIQLSATLAPSDSSAFRPSSSGSMRAESLRRSGRR